MTKVQNLDENLTELTINDLADKTPAQAEIWIENNVNDLATAKTVLKKMARYMVAVARILEEIDGQ